MILISIVYTLLVVMSFSLSPGAHGADMDVKCTVYEHEDDENGNDVDVRIFVMGLKGDNDYTANVRPDHNPPTNVTTKSDSDGIFWVIARIPHGEKSTLFRVNVYEGNNADGSLVSSGDDDAPCYGLPSRLSKSSS